MHVSIANISKTVTDRVNITIVIKYEVAYERSITILKFDLGLL